MLPLKVSIGLTLLFLSQRL